MTFEEFRELAANPPRRNHYPKSSVMESRIGFARTVADGEPLITEAIKQAAECQTYGIKSVADFKSATDL